MGASKVTLYIATSVDGFIADENGGIEWLDEFQRESENGDDVDGYEEFFASVDCLVMGSKTYERVLTFGDWPYEDRPTYVLTNRDLTRATDAVELVDGDVDFLATELRRQYEHVWVVGGGQVARALFRERQIDELRLSLVPVLLGSGVPLFSASGEQQRLRLLESTNRETGIVELQYQLST